VMRRSADRFALPTARGAALELEPRIKGLGQDVDADRRWLRTVARPWAVDLFCGAGGLSLGLQAAGFNVVAAADADERAVETHAANVAGMAWQMDLSDPGSFIERLRRRGIEHVDVVAGGPPCQPFSRAGAAKLRSLVANGTRPAEDERVPLWRSFLDVIDALQPRAVLVENVPDMARWADGEILVSLMAALRQRGLDPEARVLRTWEYGVPQHRQRLFVVATRGFAFRWPRRRTLVTLRDAIADLPVIPPAQRNASLPYDGPATTPFQRRARQGLGRRASDVVWDHCSRDVRRDDAEAFALLPPGGTYASLPPQLRRYRVDIFDDKYKRLEWDEVSRTITAHIAKDGYWYIHPDQDRTLSIREAARIQTFPDRFRFAGHPTVQFRQIGNAVPPAVARAVGQRLNMALRDERRARPTAWGRLRDWPVPADDIDPWLRGQDAWLVLAGEVTLRRVSRAVAEAGWRVLLEHASTPKRAAASSTGLREGLLHAGVRSSRCEALVRIGSSVVNKHNGDVPADRDALLTLPEIGEHVATAVRCFGFGQHAIFLDSATRRLATRLSGRECASAWTTRLELYRLTGHDGPDRDFNIAVRALTRTYCTVRAPRCDDCPLSSICRSRRVGRVRKRQPSTT
jgi:DNA (cytosine-5)-methyltransferase 1